MAEPVPHLSILYDIHRISRFVSDLVEESLSDVPLSGMDYALYSWLVVTAPARVSEVAAGIAVPVATASKMLDRLEERGHLTKADNPEDGRSTLVALTEAGRAAHRDAAVPFGKALRTLHAELGGSLEGVKWALGRLDEALRDVLFEEKPSDTPSRPSHSIHYDGAGLSAGEEAEVLAHIDYLRWRRDRT